MENKVIAIVGSYRKGGITDQAIDAILESARQKGKKTEKIYLTEKRIEFCANCRFCAKDDPKKIRGKCVFTDDMDDILTKIESADSLVMGAPTNFGGVTAIMKRFVERLIAYAYWPWDKLSPELRIKEHKKKAILLTSTACPALIARFLMPCPIKTLKTAAGAMGAKPVRILHLGSVCFSEKQKLDDKQLRMARDASALLA